MKLKAKRRAIYSYPCRICGKKRFSLVYLRALDRVCRKCKKGDPPPNQEPLFENTTSKENSLRITASAAQKLSSDGRNLAKSDKAKSEVGQHY